jgi:Pre ATP-grasp domain/Carbamoyl-phosphate synthase L chain, ATP binding domain
MLVQTADEVLAMPRRAQYLGDLKRALVGDESTRLVFICNFEVESQWAHGHQGLPAAPFSSAPQMVRRMEELGALLAGPDDFLVLSQPLDPEFRAYVRDLGLSLPTEVIPERLPGSFLTTEAVFASPLVLARLRELGQSRAYLMPMGCSALEQKVAEVTGLRLAGADADTAERVNGKIYGRRLTERAGLRPVPGTSCETVAELADCLRDYEASLDERPVVVKDSFGVSGKGLVVLDTAAKARRLLAMAERRARRQGTGRLEVVVEEWLPKRCDLNYQITIGRTGEVRLDFIKEALTAAGVHKGHLMPPALTGGQVGEIEIAAQRVGAALFRDGYHGVAGIDAILGDDGTVYPVLEINARLNMSTYQGNCAERFHRPGWVALARHYAVHLTAPCTFGAVTAALAGLLDPASPDGGLVITCFGTINALAGTREPFAGRLYTMLFAPGTAALGRLDAAAEARLGALWEG